jgi:dihydroceramide fatty acyl 2-hydroxylase
MRRADILKASPPMFESRFLDRFSRVHWSVPLIVFGPVVTALFVLSAVESVAWYAVIGLAAAGWVFWTLTEYWLHRVVFHFEPEDGIGARMHWMIHGVHHDHPNDPKRLVMPPAVSLPLAALFFGLFVLVFGLPLALPFTAGFLVGYLIYDMSHYYVHHNVPRTWAGKKLRELHMRHHFQDHERGYGVSAPWWDYVFRTAHKQRSRAR